MQDSIRPVAQLYGVNTALFGRALDGLDREALLRRSTVDVKTLPEIDGIRAAWDALGPQLWKRFDEATPEQLAAPAPKKFAIEDTSIRGAITFLSWHEGYHMGQMSLLRRWLGHPGLVG